MRVSNLPFLCYYLSPARQLDKVNLQGFYVWKLQDGHAPQFGLFTSTHHESKAKASIAVYNNIITRGGFPEDDTMKTCRLSELHEPCLVCGWMFKNKAILVFGGCILITAVMLATLVIFVIYTKRNQTQGRRRGVKRKRKIEGVPVCLCPPLKC